MKRNRRIPALDPYRKPAPSGGPFAALNWPQQRAAEQLLWEWVPEVGDQPPPVALGDPRCAGAAAGAASSHVYLGEADAMPARWAGRAEGLQVARDRPDRQGDRGAAQ